jgi:hypothetical protein
MARHARCDVSDYKPLNGVLIRIVQFDDEDKIIADAHVIYTPEHARRVAHDLLTEADRVDATGGPTTELQTLCPSNPEADQRQIKKLS